MVDITDIKRLAKEIENKYDLNYYEILQRYMFERVLERISISKYQDNFILKGGLLLSAMFGIDNRMTKDMDATITGIDVSKDKMLKVLNEILSINLKDGVKFDVVDITDIREEDEYGGNKYHIVGKLQSLKVNLEIDISTGDKVTPRELKYKYPLIFEDRTIMISGYNIETILAEKIETVLRRGVFNSRMKDFYDIYYFLTKLRKEIDLNILKEAIDNTFSKRNSFEYLNDYEQIIDSIIGNERLENLWNIYSNKYKYANGIDINEILDLLKDIIKELELEVVAV
ncbi:MAG: nucleotidyl transferase AbiEii/AbiGii toxin family protein [Mycoplasmatota bacterium]|nr:nucleotidyl transferase AbiEii/AbiGii toxin family protein [Mycoplasmatota bacterium]